MVILCTLVNAFFKTTYVIPYSELNGSLFVPNISFFHLKRKANTVFVEEKETQHRVYWIGKDTILPAQISYTSKEI